MFYSTGRHTESVGTNIVEVCPAQGIKVPVLRAFSATAGATAQSLYVMTPVGIFETDDFTDAGETTTRVTTTKPGRNDAGALVTLSSGDLVVAINRDEGVSVLLVEQNSRMALSISHRAYAMATGNIVIEGNSKELLHDDRIKAAYLGGEV